LKKAAPASYGIVEERRQYYRIIVFNLGIVFHADTGERFDVVNVAEAGLCLRRSGAPRVKPGHPVSGKLLWPARNIEKEVKGVICWSRLVDDGDMFYGVHADMSWLIDSLDAADHVERDT
jgi:hypothetical protein